MALKDTNLEELLVGSKITKITKMSKSEVEMNGWFNAPMVIHLDKNIKLFAMSDDEGNDGGTLICEVEDHQVYVY